MSTDGHTFDLQRLFWTQTTDHHVNISLFLHPDVFTAYEILRIQCDFFLVKTQIVTYSAFCELIL